MSTAEPYWLLTEYAPVALFSLRPSITTAAGGQTLLVPTPYAIKLALTDATIRAQGVGAGQSVFDAVQPMEVRLRPPAYSVVTHTFNRVRWPARGDKADTPTSVTPDPDEAMDSAPSSQAGGPWATRIAYREYCFHTGSLEIAFHTEGCDAATVDCVRLACSMVTYFGKRGSFFQFIGTRTLSDLPTGFDENADPPPLDLNYAQIQLLDDMPREPRADLWEKVNSLSPARVSLEEDRLVRGRMRLLPVRRIRSGRSFTLYGRTV